MVLKKENMICCIRLAAKFLLKVEIHGEMIRVVICFLYGLLLKITLAKRKPGD